ncbi:MAG: hypothetical protein R3351_07115 [Nitrospirales bacterium]|nr:hypothetical protein [Nitrospirales bacterium]
MDPTKTSQHKHDRGQHQHQNNERNFLYHRQILLLWRMKIILAVSLYFLSVTGTALTG